LWASSPAIDGFTSLKGTAWWTSFSQAPVPWQCSPELQPIRP
jgi:hypothetical protein